MNEEGTVCWSDLHMQIRRASLTSPPQQKYARGSLSLIKFKHIHLDLSRFLVS